MSTRLVVSVQYQKKGKSQKLLNNYRRITITSIIGKVIELHMLSHSRPILDPIQSPHQFGFSKGCSPIYAALLLTEIMAEASDLNQHLYITLLDTSKAFAKMNRDSGRDCISI